MEEGRKGAEVVDAPGGGFGEGEKASLLWSVSNSRRADREAIWSQGGGEMFARHCFFRRRASQRGMLVLWGGWRGVVGPFELGRRKLA
jgi:hypothetical protein